MRNTAYEITKELLHKYFSYDEKTGNLIRKIKVASNADIGMVAGTITKSGYISIIIHGHKLRAHRCVWLYHYGKFPCLWLDHINGNGLDNRIENLREVDNRQNQQNRKRHRQGKLVGASYKKNDKLWTSEIKVNKKRFHLGYFKTELAAHEAYMKAVGEL